MVIQDIQERVRSGFKDWHTLGDIKAEYLGDKVILNYVRPQEWNEYELVCRGLVLTKQGDVLARPFDKFFYWSEGGRYGKGHIKNVSEKIDGSLGICFHDPFAGKARVVTRGSFVSDQAQWATEFLHKNFTPEKFPLAGNTFLFEIVYPENRIVVDYGNTSKLVLLAVRNNHTGEYMDRFPDLYEFAFEHGLELAPTWSFNSLTSIFKATGDPTFRSLEGWVVEMSDGSYWKFKTDEYLTLHKIFSGNLKKHLVKYLKEGTLLKLYEQLPTHLKIDAKTAARELQEQHSKLYDHLIGYFSASPKESDRKAFALWVQNNVPKNYQHYMFKLYDKQAISSTIWEKEF